MTHPKYKSETHPPDRTIVNTKAYKFPGEASCENPVTRSFQIFIPPTYAEGPPLPGTIFTHVTSQDPSVKAAIYRKGTVMQGTSGRC